MNLLFDANFLLHQVLHTTKYMLKFKKQNDVLFFDKQEHIDAFTKKFLTDLNYYINNEFEDVNKVFLFLDSYSWRKNYNDVYKSSRSDSREKSDINFSKVFEVFDEITEKLKNFNFEVIKVQNLEADDLIYIYSKMLLKQNENCIIITSDKDLMQLVDFNEKSFIAYYNSLSKHRKIITKIGTSEKLIKDEKNDISLDDLFNITEIIQKNELSKLINKNVEYTEIDPRQIIIEKIILGDSSDEIESSYIFENKIGNSNRITNSFLKSFKEIDNFTFDNLINLNENLIDSIIFKINIKIKNKEKIDKELFINNLKRNMMLVYLNKEFFPNEIKTEVNKIFKNLQNTKIGKYINKFSKEDLFENFGFKANENTIEIYF